MQLRRGLYSQMPQGIAAKQIFTLVGEIPNGIRIRAGVFGEVFRRASHGVLAWLHEPIRSPDHRPRRTHHAKFLQSVVRHAQPCGATAEPMLQAVVLTFQVEPFLRPALSPPPFLRSFIDKMEQTKPSTCCSTSKRISELGRNCVSGRTGARLPMRRRST